MQALLSYDEKLHVLTAPTDMIPLDLISAGRCDPRHGHGADQLRLRHHRHADDDGAMDRRPCWRQAHVYFAMLELDMRSAQNALRLIRALKAEELPFDKLRFVLNRAPGFTDLSGKAGSSGWPKASTSTSRCSCPTAASRWRRPATTACRWRRTRRKNPLRKEIAQAREASVHDRESGPHEAEAKG